MMASDTTNSDDPLQTIDCESVPIAPGTKRGPRTPIDGEQQPTSMRVWWLVGAIVAAALIVGVLIGRLL
jgi:hypothetical protein